MSSMGLPVRREQCSEKAPRKGAPRHQCQLTARALWDEKTGFLRFPVLKVVGPSTQVLASAIFCSRSAQPDVV